MRMTFVDVLDELGYAVAATRDPREALAQLGSAPPPAAIVLDLPVQLAGVPALYEALRTRPELVATAVFLFDEVELPPAEERPGLVHMFEHPVSLRSLAPALDAVLGR